MLLCCDLSWPLTEKLAEKKEKFMKESSILESKADKVFIAPFDSFLEKPARYFTPHQFEI